MSPSVIFAGDQMKRFVEGTDRDQATLFAECLEDWMDDDKPVRAIAVFVDELDLADLGFERVAPKIRAAPLIIPPYS